jgi:5-methylcytosine-specific restriction endonuclease McrA
MNSVLNNQSNKYKLFDLIKLFCQIQNLPCPTKKNQSQFLVSLYEDSNFDMIKRNELVRNYTQNQFKKMRVRLINEYGEKCMKCNSTSQIEVDHIIPYSWNPDLSMDYGNLQLLCKSCNIKKGNRNANDFRIYSLD